MAAAESLAQGDVMTIRGMCRVLARSLLLPPYGEFSGANGHNSTVGGGHVQRRLRHFWPVAGPRL
jgi:hypothetical protein